MSPEETSKRNRARAAVKLAIIAGNLVKPDHCSECGEQQRFGSDGRSLLHAHHHRGYDNPLDVEWLCVVCHVRHDPRKAQEENGRAKLNASIVASIRERYTPGINKYHSRNSARALAREFGVHNRTVSRILRNEIWIDAALKEG